MDITLFRPVFQTELNAPSSKSELHRLLLCALLGDRRTEIFFDGDVSDDIAATADGCRALGAQVVFGANSAVVTPPDSFPTYAELDCRLSGTTLRFFTALCAGFGIRARLRFSEGLSHRPMAELLLAIEKGGAEVSRENDSILLTKGTNTSCFAVEGGVSSQFVSGLLFASLRQGGRVRLLSELQSADYVKMTINALSAFGCTVTERNGELIIPARFPLSSSGAYTAGGDWSNAAYALIGGCIGKRSVTVRGLSLSSAQGDKRITELLCRMGADIKEENGALTAFPSVLHGISVSGRDIPDIILPLSVAMTQADGESTITDIDRLRYKETDRIRSAVDLIDALGGKAVYENGVLRVTSAPLSGGKVNGYSDHRTVMAAALAATVCENEVTVSDAEAVNKSFPGFFSQFQ